MVRLQLALDCVNYWTRRALVTIHRSARIGLNSSVIPIQVTILYKSRYSYIDSNYSHEFLETCLGSIWTFNAPRPQRHKDRCVSSTLSQIITAIIFTHSIWWWPFGSLLYIVTTIFGYPLSNILISGYLRKSNLVKPRIAQFLPPFFLSPVNVALLA